MRFFASAALVAAVALASPAPALAQDRPATKADKVDELLRQLGAEGYDEREAATQALIKAGPRVSARVRKVYQETKDPEVKARARFILEKVGAPNPEKKEPQRTRPRRPNAPKAAPNPFGRGGQNPFGQGGMPDMEKLFKDFGMGGDVNKLFAELFKEFDFNKIFEEEFKRLQEGQPGQPRQRQRVFRFQGGPNGLKRVDPKPAAPAAPADKNRSAMGLVVEDMSPTLRAQLSLPKEGGLVIAQIIEGSFAESSPLKSHDILLKVNGKTIKELPELVAALKKGPAKVEVLRAGARKTITVPKLPAKTKRKDF